MVKRYFSMAVWLLIAVLIWQSGALAEPVSQRMGQVYPLLPSITVRVADTDERREGDDFADTSNMWSKDQFSPSGNFVRRYYLFKEELPSPLAEPMADWGYGEVRILSGAAIEEPGDSQPMKDEPASYPSFSALMLVENHGETQLVGAAWVEGQPWQVVNFGSKLLRKTTDLAMGILECPGIERPGFAVSYWNQDGSASYFNKGSDMFDLFCFSGNRLWEMIGHSTNDLIISTAVPFTIVIDASGRRTEYDRRRNFWMEYMESIDAYPTSLEDCLKLQLNGAEDSQWHHTDGAILRKEPSQSAESLGVYAMYVPLRFTGETSPGKEWPWYRVCIGDTLGWMSSLYVNPGLPVPQFPLRAGRTVPGCVMLRCLGDHTSAVQIQPGETFHILGETSDGWVHVCIPSGTFTADIDLRGTYGYIRKEDMITGASLSALEALEREMAGSTAITPCP